MMLLYRYNRSQRTGFDAGISSLGSIPGVLECMNKIFIARLGVEARTEDLSVRKLSQHLSEGTTKHEGSIH